jgi:hypothetical protein
VTDETPLRGAEGLAPGDAERHAQAECARAGEQAVESTAAVLGKLAKGLMGNETDGNDLGGI